MKKTLSRQENIDLQLKLNSSLIEKILNRADNFSIKSNSI